MPSTRNIRRRIRSVKSTAQITKAMQMVASSKMRKAQQAALAGRPYARLLYRIQRMVTTHAGDFHDRLMEARPVLKRAVILISTDKGLCGALNSNLFREASKLETGSTAFITAGRKAAQFVARTRRELVAEFSYKDQPQFGEARVLVKTATEMFLSGKVDKVDLLFTRFVNTLSQQAVLAEFLPIGEIKALSRSADLPSAEGASGGGSAETNGAAELGLANEFTFEPDARQVLGALLPHYLNFYLYQVLLEAKASEQSARMVAMKNATDNASQLIKDLTLEYNKMRQAAITNELLEISSAAMSLG
jgi:F-type H+-transporting ATPase subunit gamma